MRITTTILAALLATSAFANDTFGKAKSLSASGFVNGPQAGSWSVGAMNDTHANAKVFNGRGTTEVQTGTSSTTEGFGSNFGGIVAAKGVSKSFGKFGRR